jgi:hypothetical protein
MLAKRLPADLGVKPEALGVALVQLGDRLVRLLLGQILAREVRVEPVEVDLPPRRVLRAEGSVVEDVGEDEETAVAVRPELETKLFGSPCVGEQPRWIELGDLAFPLA